MKTLLTKLTLAAVFVACSGSAPKTPTVLMVVDTNLPVPRVITNVRFDFYSDDGQWFDTRTESATDVRSWPLTFSIAGTPGEPTKMWIRIRGYNEAYTREYSGETYQPWPEMSLEPKKGNGEPRLIKDEADITPPREPTPQTTVDRLVKVDFNAAQQGKIAINLDGACVGHMAELAPKWTSCHSEVEMRVSESASPIDPDTTRPASRVGTIGQVPCPPEPYGHRSPCVVGGAFILGPSNLDNATSEAARIVVVPTFRMQQTEVTVRQLRRAVQDEHFELPTGVGLAETPPHPISPCSLTNDPGPNEAWPMNCIPFASARAYCQHYGGDLPTEAEWEYATTSSSRERKTLYPWGDTSPVCSDVIFGRLALAGSPGMCGSLGSTPVPIENAQGEALPFGDVTPDDIRHLSGSVSEWTRDSAALLSNRCWLDTPTISPLCNIPGSRERTVRGGSWAAPFPAVATNKRLGVDEAIVNAYIGFRCVFH